MQHPPVQETGEPSGERSIDRRDDHRGPFLSFVAVQEGLREGSDDDRGPAGLLPGAVIPPLHIAGTKPVLGTAAISLVAVDEVEPVALGAGAPFDPVDRLDEPASVTGLHMRLPLERLHGGQPGRHSCHEQDVGAAVARHPEGGPATAARGRAAGGESGRETKDGETDSHRTAFERTAPIFVARTRPR